jgi:DNA-binding LacI/PurR family transcriptional regulator
MLEQEGWVQSMSHGYRAIHKARPKHPLHTVIHIQSLEGCGPFTQHVALGASKRCRQLGLGMEVRWADPAYVPHQLVEFMASMPGPHVGWLLSYFPAWTELSKSIKVPQNVVLLDHASREQAIPRAMLNHRDALDLALRHLKQYGHRRVAILISPKRRDPNLRTIYDDACALRRQLLGWREAEWDVDPRTDGPVAPREVQYVFRDWLELWQQTPETQRPSSVLVSNLPMALIFLAICRSARVAVPGKLSVIAVGSELGRPEDSAVVTHASAGRATEVGEMAVDILIRAHDDRQIVVAETEAALYHPNKTVAAPA